jgi:hypothetical protein
MAVRSKFLAFTAVVLLLSTAIVAIGAIYKARNAYVSTPEKDRIRAALFAELRPVKLSNCELQRFGEQHDGGYLLCANLLSSAQAGYSYGISGYDGWGCDVSSKLKVRVHQYDCFDLNAPSCPAGNTVFHGECVAGAPFREDGRAFDTIAGQVAKNGDAAKHLVMKMDVEGAEWDSLAKSPDSVFQQIDQLEIEFHENDEAKFVDVVKRLKQFFYVAHIHYNNYGCNPGYKPFPSWAYEVLFVSQRLGVLDLTGPTSPARSAGQAAQAGPIAATVDPLDAPNAPWSRDCQSAIE